MNKYYKNMILCSEMDFHCLLCEESFEIIANVEKHLLWEKHRQSFKKQIIGPKYKECIHKIGQSFYCEICNCILKCETLQEHIKSDVHKERKCNPEAGNKRIGLGKREGSGSIKFPKLLINRLQWHGISNRRCLLCDVLVEDVNNHINTTKHMVNIIQSQVLENADCYFRKIDQNCYCFSCGHIINDESMNKHNCKKESKLKKGANKKTKNDENKKKCESPGLLKMIADVEKDRYDINIKEKTAKCKLCNIGVDPTFKALSKHTHTYHEDTVKYVDPEDHGKLRSELAAYGRENFIKLNEGGSKGYCSLCDIYLSANMKVAKGHVNGVRHRGHLELKGLVAHKKHSLPGRKVQPLQHFLKDMFHAKPLNAMCINFSLCVNGLSFMFIATVNNEKKPKRKCFCCDVVFNCEDLKEHWTTKQHRDAFVGADVLMMDNEFIRIIRPGLFHCGFCNQVFPFWEAMGRHISSWAHGYAKQKHELVYTLAMQWYAEHETNGAVHISDELYLNLIELGIM